MSKLTKEEVAMIGICRSEGHLGEKISLLNRVDKHYNLMDLVVKLADMALKRRKRKATK